MAKYCQRANPTVKNLDTGQSRTWNTMLQNKPKMEPHIQWEICSGTSYFWWDNWLGVGPLAHHTVGVSRLNNTRVTDFLNNGQWDVHKILQVAPPLLIPSILSHGFLYNADKLSGL